jgi:hypothetical protein
LELKTGIIFTRDEHNINYKLFTRMNVSNIKTRPAGGKTAPWYCKIEEDIFMQDEKIPEALSHPYPYTRAT